MASETVSSPKNPAVTAPPPDSSHPAPTSQNTHAAPPVSPIDVSAAKQLGHDDLQRQQVAGLTASAARLALSPKSPSYGPAHTPENITMIEAFEWWCPADKQHWNRLNDNLEALKATGIDNIWIPPACKGAEAMGNGYDIYDMYDLGEFNQKGDVSTKWGNKRELQALCWKAHALGMGIYFDAVINHKAGADGHEECIAVEVDPNFQSKDLTKPAVIDAWVKFDYEARGGKYSSMKYGAEHFDGTDYDQNKNHHATFRIVRDPKNESKFTYIDQQRFDYLMFADMDYGHPAVTEDVINWGKWIGTQIPIKGVRIDACRHISERFIRQFKDTLDKAHGRGWFYVGELWDFNPKVLVKFLDMMDNQFNLFDAPMVWNFARLSDKRLTDLRKVFEKTLVEVRPKNSVTIVMNHDTQPGQACEQIVQDWFKTLAYALILLRVDGYPCLFWGDIYGIRGAPATKDKPAQDPEDIACHGKIPDLTLARKLYAYGPQLDYFDDERCIGWTRQGTWDRVDGLAVVMSNKSGAEKKMDVGKQHAGEIWTDLLGWKTRKVTIDHDGFGVFPCLADSVSVYVNKSAKGRDLFGKFPTDIYEDN